MELRDGPTKGNAAVGRRFKLPPDSPLGQWRAAGDPKLAEQVQTLLSGPRPAKTVARPRGVRQVRDPSKARCSPASRLPKLGQAAAEGSRVRDSGEAVHAAGGFRRHVRTRFSRCGCRRPCSAGASSSWTRTFDGPPGDRVVRVLAMAAPSRREGRQSAGSTGPPDDPAQHEVGRTRSRRAGRRGLSAADRGATTTSAAASRCSFCFPRSRADRRGRVPQDVPPRGRAARPAVPRRRAEAPARPPLGRASLHQPAAGGRERVPAAVHRLRDAGSAEGAAGLLREPARAVPQAGRGVREGRRGRGPEAAGRAARRSPRGPTAGRCRTRRRPSCSALYASAAQEGSRPRRGVPRRAGAGAGVAGVPVPHRAGAAGEGGPARQRLGTGHAAQLLPLVVGAGRRTAPARGGGPAPRPEGAGRQTQRMLKDDRRAGAGDRVRHAVDSRPRLRRAEGEEREAVPDVRRPAAQGDLRGIDPVLPGPVPERPAGDAASSTPITRSSTRRWRSTTASPASTGPQWRRVEGVRKYGRGGILGLASVQAKQAGASRTSPVLRGNWVVETLLGEKLPRPPANVPQLPEEEGGTTGSRCGNWSRSTHASPECAVCHVRIDPFGFALEKYDPIGRLPREGPRRPGGRLRRRSSRTAPSSTASTACGPTC